MAVTWEDIAQALLTCACSALGAQDPPWEGECCVVQNEPEYDSCCNDDNGVGGQLWVKWLRTYPTSVLPAEDPTADITRCNLQWAVLFEVGVVRCVCWDMCDCALKGENAAKVMKDAQALLNGLVCCFAQGGCTGLQGRVITQESIDMETGCAGSKITLAVAAGTCCA